MHIENAIECASAAALAPREMGHSGLHVGVLPQNVRKGLSKRVYVGQDFLLDYKRTLRQVRVFHGIFDRDDLSAAFVGCNLAIYGWVFLSRVAKLPQLVPTAVVGVLPSDLVAFLANRRSAGASIRTSNFQLGAVKAFCRWMVADRRAGENPLAHLKGQNDKTDRRRGRRVLTPEELRLLLASTRNGPERQGVPGAERAVLYQLAVETGLRASELRLLTWDCVALDTEPPTVKVRAAYSKHRRDDTQPMTTGTVQMLIRWRTSLAGPALSDRVFPNLKQWTKTGKMLRGDLEVAQAEWVKEAKDNADRRERESSDFLAYVDDAGRYADFHALRHTFITNLSRGGVHPKVAQSLARHSSITLTMDRYSHTVLGEQVDALHSLPDLSDGPKADQLRSTGTDDA